MPRFALQLYLRDAKGYDEDRKLTAIGTVTGQKQRLSFVLPAGVHGLRLDLAEQPGWLCLHSMRLQRDGRVVWHWQGDIDGWPALAGCAHQQMMPAAGSASPSGLVLLYGNDPWLELPVAAQAFEGFAQLELEVALAWPASADAQALARAVQPVLAEAQAELARARVELREVRARLLELERPDFEARIQEAVDACAQNAAQERNLEVRKVTRSKLAVQQELADLRAQFGQLADHLRCIEASTVFRVTRPLVRAKLALGRWLRRGPAAAPAAPAARPIAATVDVIVPVYLNLEATRRCIEAVRSATPRTPWRLVLVNDASPEPAVTAWLRELAAGDSRLVLLENPVNLGFSGTVNRGMSLSGDHDVVLLNSDTEVANDWLDRLRAPAYRQARVCSVTPFSNNATICSYPNFCEANAMPAGCSVAELDRAFAQANPGQVLDVPTGVGFCMYIRRDCLREVGLFDTEQFGKGYGEEDDFCQRAAQAGWRNLHALDVFVQHTGGVSFGHSKNQRELEAMVRLRQLHPGYEPAVHEYIRLDPPAVARHRAGQALAALRAGTR